MSPCNGNGVCGMDVQGATYVRCTELEDNTAAERLHGPEGLHTRIMNTA